MASRNRKEVATLFDVFCEVGASMDSDGGAMILQKYPDDFSDEQTLKSITQFSFPCALDDDDVEAVQLFSFVLTDQKSQYTFAFCRHTPRNNTCLCILSGLPWASTFYAILNHVSEIMNNRPANEVELLLTCAYHTPIPNAGDKFHIDSGNGLNKLELVVPDSNRLPTLRDDKYMLEFYNALSEKQMIALYASLLKERRIIFTGRKLSQLSSCIFAAATLLYPMHWQNLFIPVLPSHLIDMLMAPMPYLVGVPKKTLKAAKQLDIGDTVLIDIDHRTLRSTHNDVNDLPAEAAIFLRNQLRSSADMFFSDGLARSFLRTNVILFGGYRLGLCHNQTTIKWDREKFVLKQRASLQPFLRSLIGQDGVQYLERFIEERLQTLNAGHGIDDDEFEREIRLMDTKRPKSSQLTNPEVIQQAVSSVRENANDMFGAIKDKVHSISLKERFVRLTPKEPQRRTTSPSQSPSPSSTASLHRTHKHGTSLHKTTTNTTTTTTGAISNSSSKTRTSPEAVMSFDTQQWTLDDTLQLAASRLLSPPLSSLYTPPAENGDGHGVDTSSVVVGDLIDLGDGPPAASATVGVAAAAAPPAAAGGAAAASAAVSTADPASSGPRSRHGRHHRSHRNHRDCDYQDVSSSPLTPPPSSVLPSYTYTSTAAAAAPPAMSKSTPSSTLITPNLTPKLTHHHHHHNSNHGTHTNNTTRSLDSFADLDPFLNPPSLSSTSTPTSNTYTSNTLLNFSYNTSTSTTTTSSTTTTTSTTITSNSNGISSKITNPFLEMTKPSPSSASHFAFTNNTVAAATAAANHANTNGTTAFDGISGIVSDGNIVTSNSNSNGTSTGLFEDSTNLVATKREEWERFD